MDLDGIKSGMFGGLIIMNVSNLVQIKIQIERLLGLVGVMQSTQWHSGYFKRWIELFLSIVLTEQIIHRAVKLSQIANP